MTIFLFSVELIYHLVHPDKCSLMKWVLQWIIIQYEMNNKSKNTVHNLMIWSGTFSINLDVHYSDKNKIEVTSASEPWQF